MRLRVNMTGLTVISVFLTAVTMALPGCLPESATVVESVAPEPPHLLGLIAAWAERAEGKDVRALREITVSDGDKSDGKVSFSVNIHSWKSERYAEPHVILQGTAEQDTVGLLRCQSMAAPMAPHSRSKR